MTINGRCHCGGITWKISGKVDFTAVCHCTDCQTFSGSGYGSTHLVVYDPEGVQFGGDGEPKTYKMESEAGVPTQRGFCPNCGTQLFNHVNEGKEDEHWAIYTGSMVDSRAIRMEKEIFMKSKLSWVPIVTKPEGHYPRMPKRTPATEKTSQTTIEATMKHDDTNAEPPTKRRKAEDKEAEDGEGHRGNGHDAAGEEGKA